MDLVSTQDSGGDVTGSSQLEVQSVYSFNGIPSFLQETKGMRQVKAPYTQKGCFFLDILNTVVNNCSGKGYLFLGGDLTVLQTQL